MAGRDTFYDPNTSDLYEWHVNHDVEEAFGKDRNVNHSGLTDGVGLVRQQAEDSPMVIAYTGTILHDEQYEEFWKWFVLSRTQGIRYFDFTGPHYEVVITSFQPVRKRGHNRRTGTMYYWTYSLKMEVLRFINGPLQEIGVTP